MKQIQSKNKALASLRKYIGKETLRGVCNSDLKDGCTDLITDTLHFALDKGIDVDSILFRVNEHLKAER